MQRLAQPASRRVVRLPAAGIMAAAAGLLVLSGCSAVPDYANPVEWYRSAVDVFDDDVPPPPPAEDVPGAHEAFPSVGEVPEAPAREVALSELEAVGEGLAADREDAQYTDEILRSDSASEVLQPTYQEPVQPLPEPTPLPETQTTVATQQYAALPAPPAQLSMATGQPVDVKLLFTSLFQSSGPRAVSPGTATSLSADGAGTLSSGGVSTLPDTDALTGGASYAGTFFGSSQAAVIYFAFGSAWLTKDSRAALHKVADVYKRRGGTIRVVGHASNRTRELSAEQHELVNFDVSFKRARAVADELIRHGVPAASVAIVAKSDSEPVYHEWMPSGEAGNRRVEVFMDF